MQQYLGFTAGRWLWLFEQADSSIAKFRSGGTGEIDGEQSRDYSALVICIIVCHGLLIITVDNAITAKARKRDNNARELKLANAAITDMQMRQRDVAALDAKYTKELADAKAENDALRDDVAAGHWLHIKVSPSVMREATIRLRRG